MTNKLKKLFSSRRAFIALALVLLVAAALLAPHFALAQSTPTDKKVDSGMSLISKAIAQILAAILGTIAAFEGSLATMLTSLLIKVAQFNSFIGSAAVQMGWVVIRDVCNMFFIIVLLLIAISTILKVESYNYKKLLPKVLLLALLINFSKTMCGLAIDASQVVMLTFVNGFKDTGAGNFLNATGLPRLMSFQTGANPQDFVKDITLTSIAASYLLACLYLAVVIVVLIINTIILVWRVVMLWILIILSPLFFLLMAFPSGATYAKQWSSQFVKYLIVGPLLAFFLWLSLSVFANLGAEMQKGVAGFPADGAPTGDTPQATVGPSQAGTWSFAGQFLVAMCLLITGLTMTGSLGVAGGSLASGAVGKMQALGTGVLKAPLRGAGFLAKRGRQIVATKMADNRVGKYLTGGYWKGIGARGDRLYAESQARAEAKGQTRRETLPIIGMKKEAVANYVESQYRAEAKAGIDKQKKDMGEPSTGALVNATLKAKMDNSGDGDNRRISAILNIAGEGNWDDYYEHLLTADGEEDQLDANGEQMKDADGNVIKKKILNKDNFENYDFENWDQARTMNDQSYRVLAMNYLDLNRKTYDPEMIRKNLMAENPNMSEKDARDKSRAMAMDAANGASEKDKKKLWAMSEMGELVKGVGHWEQTAAAKDAKTGANYIMDDEQRIGHVIGLARKTDLAKLRSNMATHSFVPRVMDNDGQFKLDPNIGEKSVTPFMQKMFSLIDGAWIRDIHRQQSRTSPHIIRHESVMGKEDAWVKQDGSFTSPAAYQNFQKLMVQSGNPDAIRAEYDVGVFKKGDADIAPDVGESLERFEERRVAGAKLADAKNGKWKPGGAAGQPAVAPAPAAPAATAAATKPAAPQPAAPAASPILDASGRPQPAITVDLSPLQDDINELSRAIQGMGGAGGKSEGDVKSAMESLGKKLEEAVKGGKAHSGSSQEIANAIKDALAKQDATAFNKFNETLKKYLNRGGKKS